jgi:hypothetical protein
VVPTGAQGGGTPRGGPDRCTGRGTRVVVPTGAQKQEHGEEVADVNAGVMLLLVAALFIAVLTSSLAAAKRREAQQARLQRFVVRPGAGRRRV